MSAPQFMILSRQEILYYLVVVAVAPIAIAVVGVGIWWRRKKL